MFSLASRLGDPRRLAYALRNYAREKGLELGRSDPDRSLGLFLVTLFRHRGVNCVLDVGAHHGEYGTFLRRNGYKGYIISFEPVGTNFHVLERLCGGDKRWFAHKIALGSTSGTSTINVTSGTNFSSFQTPSAYGVREFDKDMAIDHTEQVRVERLDAIFTDLLAPITTPRVFLKVDAQGWDLEVLKGAASNLDAITALQVEVSFRPVYEGAPTFFETVPYLGQIGFDVTGIFTVYRDQQLRLGEVDCIMVHRS